MKKKRVMALLLCLAMCMSSFAGCGKGEEAQDTQTPAVESEADEASVPEEIPVDYFAGTELEIAILKKTGDMTTDPNEKAIMKKVEADTGIHVNWITVEEGAKDDKMGVMLASSDKPDAFIGLIDSTTMAGNLDLFYDISQDNLLETYAPDVLEVYDAVDEALDVDLMSYLTWGDGSIRALHTGSDGTTSPNLWGQSLLNINQEWLDKLGLPVPTTADELYETLIAFRDNDCDGDGDATNEIPLTFCSGNWQASIMQYANAFGIAGNTCDDNTAYKKLVNGKVESTVDKDNFRAFLEFFHKLAEEDLLDLEGFSQTADQFNAKVSEKKAGVFLNYYANDGYTAFIYQGIDGVEPVMSGLKNQYMGQKSAFVVSADCENVEALLHWWNYMSSSRELRWLAFSGEPGTVYEFADDGSVIAIPTPEGYVRDNYGFGNLGPVKTAEDMPPEDESQQSEKLINRNHWIKDHEDLYSLEAFPIKYTTAEVEEERAFIEVDLFDYISSFIATSITEGVTDESWETHLQQLENVGYYEWIQWYQDFVDGNI